MYHVFMRSLHRNESLECMLCPLMNEEKGYCCAISTASLGILTVQVPVLLLMNVLCFIYVVSRLARLTDLAGRRLLMYCWQTRSDIAALLGNWMCYW